MSQPKTIAETVIALKGFYNAHITSLNGIMDKIPEALRADFKALKDELNTQLAKLAPLDQVPAAQEAAWALNSFADAMSRMQEYATNLMTRLNAMGLEISTKATALQGLEKQVTDGELVPKAKVSELCGLAKDEGVKSVLPQIIALRKGAIELAGLPVPGDNILGLPEAEFTPLFAAAKGNVVKLGEKGWKLGGKGDGLVKETAWLGTTEFAGRLTTFDQLITGAGGRTADPLLGNQGAGGEDDKTKKAKGLRIL